MFDPDECAPGSKALAGNSLGYRGRAACKCEPESGLTTVKLMKKDFRVSESLGDPEVLLCGLCAEAYDERREELGCTQCGAALKQDLTIDPRFGGLASVLEGHCPSCAVSTSIIAARQLADQEAERLRAEVATLSQELATAREARPQPRHVGHPPGLDGKTPATDRCGDRLGDCFLTCPSKGGGGQKPIPAPIREIIQRGHLTVAVRVMRDDGFGLGSDPKLFMFKAWSRSRQIRESE